MANVNGLLLAGTVGVWLLARSRHNAWAGALIGLMFAIKLWPIVLLSFFVAHGRGRAIGGFLISVVVVGSVSLLGAGLEAHVWYLGVAYGTPPSAFSLPGVLSALGVDLPWISYAVLIFGLAEIWALRRRPELAYAVAVGTMILGSPVVNGNTYSLLIACLAPFAWPLTQGDRVPLIVQPAELVPAMDPSAAGGELPRPMIPA